MKVCKVVIISPAFAPCTLVGAARMTSLAGFLQKEGYAVTVVSAGKWYHRNDIWTRKIPDGIKVVEIENSKHYVKALKSKIISVFNEDAYDLCITSMGPFDTQYFLWKLCKDNKIPLVLDYRDLWLFYFYYYKGQTVKVKIKHLLLDFMSFPFEYLSIKYASAVVAVTEKNTDILKRRYKKYACKVITVYNGHEDMSSFVKEKRNCECSYSILCAGKFIYYNEKAALDLIRAVNTLNEKGIQIKIIHMGEESDNALELLKKNNVKTDNYQYIGKMGYNDAMQRLCHADAAVIIYGSKEGLGTKVFDYIGLNKPIIYSGILPSELGEFISKFDNTVIADNAKDLENGLSRLIQNKINKLENMPSERYSRKKQNERFEKLIKSIIKSENGNRGA